MAAPNGYETAPVGRAAEEGAVELPDIGEMAEAIHEAVEAGDAYHTAFPKDPDLIPGDAATRWKAAFDRLRSLDADIQKGLESF